MKDWTGDDPRNECYPCAPVVSDETDYSSQKPAERIGRRKAWVDARNDLIAERGAAAAVAAAGKNSIGHGGSS